MQKYVAAFAGGGARSLGVEKRGPKGRWKVTAELKGEILFFALHEGVMDYEGIRRRLQRWGEEVSVPIIREVLLENGAREAMSRSRSTTDQPDLTPCEDEDQLWRLFAAPPAY